MLVRKKDRVLGHNGQNHQPAGQGVEDEYLSAVLELMRLFFFFFNTHQKSEDTYIFKESGRVKAKGMGERETLT